MMYFTHEKVTDAVTRIRDVSGVCMYLVKGAEQCALIDTGVGFGDLYGYVMNLTDKEPIVIITHGHVDHAMGAGAFREVYIHPDDEMIYRAHSDVAQRKGYTAGSGISGGHPEAVQGAPESEWKETKAWEDFKFLKAGDVFDLGGIHLEVCPGGGHTLGCVTVLIPEEKMLFLGDAANDFTFLFDLSGGSNCLPLEQYRQTLTELDQITAGRYDRCMFFHGPGEGSVNMVAGVMDLIGEILAGKDDALPFAGMGRDNLKLAKAIDFSRMCRADGGVGNLVYDPALK